MTNIQPVPVSGDEFYDLAVTARMVGSFTPTYEYNMYSPVNLKRRLGYRLDYPVASFNTFYKQHANNGVFGYSVALDADGTGMSGEHSIEACTRIANQFGHHIAVRTTDHQVARAKNGVM